VAYGRRTVLVVLGASRLAQIAVWQMGWSFRFLPPPFFSGLQSCFKTIEVG
jgi:hypothetical protein